MTKTANWSEVTAVFGGTFDPPHLGHREAVLGLFRNPSVKRVLVVPAGTPPLKPQATSNEHRFKMAEMNFAGLADVQVDRRELSRSEHSGERTYSIDTVMELRREFPELAFVAGADQLAQLHLWHRFPELLPASHWIILARKPDGEALAMKTLNEWESSGILKRSPDRSNDGWQTSSGSRLKLVQTDAPALSSSQIREKIALGTNRSELLQTLGNWLQPSVLSYLMEHRIYGMTPDSKAKVL